MADRYWVGGTGTWNTTSTTNWSATSGGAGGASVPTVADSVFFDQAGTYTVTMTGALACLDFNVTGGTVTFQNGTSPTLDVRGSWSTVAATVWNTTGAITFSATTSRNITTNGITIRSPITFNGVGGTWTLQGNVSLLSTLTTTLTAGTLALSTFTLTTGLFNSSGSTARIINFGTGKIVLNSATTSTIWNTGTTTNLTISGTPLVECIGGGTAVTKTINTGAPSEANSISFSLLDTGGTPTYAFSLSNVVRNLIVNGAQTVSNVNLTIYGSFTHLTTNGTTTFTAGASAWTFAATSGSYTITNIDGFTYNFPWTFGSAASTATWTIAANLTLGATRQLSLVNGTFDFNNKTFSGAGVTIATGTPTIANTGGPGSLSLTVPITHASGSLTLPFNLTTTSASGYTLTAGTLTLNNFTLTTPAFSSSGSTARTLAFGTTGQLALTGNNITIIGAADNRNLTITGTLYVNCTYTGSVGTRTILWGSSQGGTEATAQNVSFSGTTGIVLSPSATDTIALSGGFNNIDFTGFTGTLSNTTRTIYGNLTVPASGGTFTGGGNTTTFAGTGTETITTNGRTLAFPMTFNGVGGTFRLLDNLTLDTREMSLVSGTLDLNNNTLSCWNFSSNFSSIRSIAFGTSGIISLIANFNSTVISAATLTNFTYTGTPRIYCPYGPGGFGTRTFLIGSGSGATSTNVFDVSFGSSGTGLVIAPAVDNVTLTGTFNNGDFTNNTSTIDNSSRSFYGNLTIPASGGSFAGGGSVTSIIAVASVNVNVQRTIDFPITVDSVGVTVNLLNNLTIGSSRAFTLAAGALNLNNLTLSAATFSSSGSTARSVAFGTTGQISLAGNSATIVDLATATNFSYTGTPRIVSTYIGATGTRTFNIGGTAGANSNNIFSVTTIENPITTGGNGNASSGDDGGGGGGGIGGGVGTTIDVNGGYTGGNASIASGNSLFTAVTNAGYTIGSGAGTAGGTATSPINAINGGNATGFGAGGGGAGYYGGNGGNGFFGGGGGGAAGFDGTARTGGNGGNGAIVLQMTVSGTPTYNVLTSGTSYSIPANTTFIKIWAIGAGGGGAGATADSTAGGGGGAGGISIMSSANTGTITYSIGTGGAGGSGTNNGLAGGNTTVTFDGTTLTSTGGAGGGYNSTTVSGVGGTGTNVIAIPTGIAISIATDAIALSGGFNNVDLTGFNGTFSNSTRSIYGNFTIPSTGGSLSAGTGVTSFVGSGSKTLSTGGRTLDFPVTIDGAGGTFQLLSNFAIGSTRALTHNNGTIDLNGYTLTVGTSYTTATGTKNLTFNGGSLVCPANTATAFNNAVPGGFTTTAGTGTGTISLTAATAKTFVGNNAIYNCDIDQGGAGALTITGFNTFNRIKSSYANTTANASILLPIETIVTGIVGGSANNKMLDLGPATATATAAPFRASVVIPNSSIQTASYVQANSIVFNASELLNPSTQSSVFFDGNGDCLQFNTISITSGQSFCFEAWVNFVAQGDYQVVFGGRADNVGTADNVQLAIQLDRSVTGYFGGAFASSSAGAINTGQWNHIAWTRDGTTARIFLNGNQIATGTSSGAGNINKIGALTSGPVGSASLHKSFNGYISNARIVVGSAVYTSAFTPPTSALTAIANTSLLTCQGTTFVDNGPNNFAITAVGSSTVLQFSPFRPFITNGNAPWRLYLANSINNGDTLGAVFQEYSNTAPIVYYITSGTSFTVPADWNNSNNAIHIYGAGGGSSGSYVPNSTGNRLGSAGGGGGGYTQVLNFTATPGSSLSYSIGLGGAAGSANNLSSSGGAGGNTTFASIYTANGGGGSSITSTTTTAGTGGTGATANGGVGGLGGGAASATSNSSGGGGGGSGGPNGAGANGGTGTIGGAPTTCAGGGGGGSSGGTNGTSANTATPGTGGNNFAGTRAGGIGGLGTTFGGISGGRERGRASYDILGSVGGAGGGGGGGANGPGVRDELNIGGGAGGSGATDSDFANPGTAGQSGGIIIVYYPSAVVSGNFSNMFLLF